MIYLGITIILGLLDWTGLARAVRGKFLALREEDFASAAELMGAKPKRIIGRHLLPSFMSHLIASATLSIPTMILFKDGNMVGKMVGAMPKRKLLEQLEPVLEA